MAQVELKEVFSNLKIIREQDGGKKAVYKFSGPFQEMNDVRGTKNKNGRIYNKKLWERVFGDAGVQERLSSKRMLGELDHPTDDGQIRRTSHIITEARPDWNDGVIYGTLELLNHDQGDAALIRALVDQGVQLCVSSRGFGEFMKDGCTIDPETYKLVTWDIVLDPSVPIATLKKVAESVNHNLPIESRARANFIETLAGANKETKETKSETKTIQEDSMDEKIVSLMEKNGELQATNAKNEANLNNMKELLTNKNERISALENANKSLTEKSAKLEETSAALTKANEATTNLQKQLKEYEEIEDRAIKVIESLKAKLEHADTLSEKAADTIEELMSKVKERKTNEADDADKADKDVDVKGTLRNWTPDPSKGDELEQLKGLVKTMEKKRAEGKKMEDADADAKAAADKAAADKKEKAKKEDIADMQKAKDAKDAADKKEKAKKEDADHKEPDADDKAKDEDDDADKDADGKAKTNENDDEDDDDKPYEPTAKEKKEARINMLKNLSEQTVRDGAPKKL